MISNVSNAISFSWQLFCLFILACFIKTIFNIIFFVVFMTVTWDEISQIYKHELQNVPRGLISLHINTTNILWKHRNNLSCTCAIYCKAASRRTKTGPHTGTKSVPAVIFSLNKIHAEFHKSPAGSLYNKWYMLELRPARQGEDKISNTMMKLTTKSGSTLLKVFLVHLLSPSQISR